MKRINFLLLSFLLLFSACDKNAVLIRGEVLGLNGNVKLLAEVPGNAGLTILAEQEVKDGKISLKTDQLVLPARVWIDFLGKQTFEVIVDSKDQTWIKGKARFLSEIDIVGSNMDVEYGTVKKMFKEKYEEPIAELDQKIERIQGDKNPSADKLAMLSIYQIRKYNFMKTRASYSKKLIEKNPTKELSLFLIMDELKDSTDVQKDLFSKLNIENKNSNAYKVLESRLN